MNSLYFEKNLWLLNDQEQFSRFGFNVVLRPNRIQI